jgi:hypothetical protein
MENEEINEDQLEQLNLVIPKVFVFQIPKLATSSGHKAADWPKDHLWSGRLKVVSVGKKCTIKLEHVDKEGLFAACPISKQTVEPVSDSSRYFVLRISDGRGRHATIGLGFKERTEAFDFKVALQDYENQSNDAKTEEVFAQPIGDLSIPQGGKIHVNLPGGKKKKTEAKTSGGGGLFALAPPPTQEEKEAAKKKKKSKSKQRGDDDDEPSFTTPSNTPAAQSSLGSLNADDLGFGDMSFSSGNSAQASQQQRTAQQQQQSAPDWISFD